jgi:hypothetical protein
MGPTLRYVRLATLTIVIILSGCAGSPPGEAGPSAPYAAEFKAAEAAATSDFEREVLRDGKITQQEFDEASQRFIDCASQRGVTVTQLSEGGRFSGWSVTGPNKDEVFASCQIGTVTLIEPLYNDILRNPKHLDINELESACLRRAGLAPPSYTAADYRRDAEASTFPFSMEDPAFDRCMRDPNS